MRRDRTHCRDRARPSAGSVASPRWLAFCYEASRSRAPRSLTSLADRHPGCRDERDARLGSADVRRRGRRNSRVASARTATTRRPRRAAGEAPPTSRRSRCVADGRPAAAARAATGRRPSCASSPTPRTRRSSRRTSAPRFAAWVDAGAPKFQSAPCTTRASSTRARRRATAARSGRSAGKPMLDAKDPEACGRCHEGVPRPEKITGDGPRRSGVHDLPLGGARRARVRHVPRDAPEELPAARRVLLPR